MAPDALRAPGAAIIGDGCVVGERCVSRTQSRHSIKSIGWGLEKGTQVNLFVGNLPYTTTSEDLVSLFSQYGTVERASVISDRDTGRSRGFGFCEMPDADGRKAIEALDGYEMDGRRINVNEARPRTR